MGVAEGNDWDVDVRRLFDGLVVGVWVGDDDESWLLELSGLIVGEGSWSPFGLVGDAGSGELGELDDGSLSSGFGRDSQNILGIWDGSNDSGSQEDFVVDLGDIKVDVSRLANVSQVSSHMSGVVLTGNVAVGLDKSKIVSFSLAKVLNGLH